MGNKDSNVEDRQIRKNSPVVTAIILIAWGFVVELALMRVIEFLGPTFDYITLELWDAAAVGLVVTPTAALILFIRHGQEVEASGTATVSRLRPWFHGVAAALSVLALVATILLLTNSVGRRVLKERVDKELLAIARVAAAQIDPVAHARLKDPKQLNGPEYKAAVKRLREFHAERPEVKYMYTMTRSPEGLRFGLDTSAPGDADHDGVEDQSALLELYPNPDPAMLQAFQTGKPTVSPQVQTDKWGSFISAFAPVRGPDGRVALIAGVDYTADEYAGQLAAMDRAATVGAFIGLLVSGLFGLGVFVIQRKREKIIGRLKLASRTLESQARERESFISKLTDMKQFAQTTIDALSYQVAVLDESGEIIAVNKTWSEFAEANGGQPEVCGVGVNYLSICDNAKGEWRTEAPIVAEGIRDVVSGKRDHFTLEYPCHSKTKLRWFTIRVTRFPDDGPAHVVVAHENITARKRAEMELVLANTGLESRVLERTERLEQAKQDAQKALALVDATADGVFIFDQDTFQFTYVNQGAIEQVGYSRDELHSMTVLDVKQAFDWESFRDLISPMIDRTSERINFETFHRHKDGHDVPVEINLQYVAPTDSGGQFVAVVRDITERKASQALLLAAKEEAERANRAKSEFLSRMSHELRTPLNAVLGFAQLLEMQSNDPNTLQSAESIIKGGKHLLSLVNEVLDLAKIEVGKLSVTLDSVDLSQVVDSCIEMVQQAADERGITFLLDQASLEGVQVKADSQRLVQVITNLLSNAVKYNCHEGRIEVRCIVHDKTSCRVEISDTGAGIDFENLKRLFVPFERLGDNQAEGTGLGLVVSKGLMELMGGSLVLVSTSESGSTFAIDIPTSHEPGSVRVEAVVPVNARIFLGGQELKIVYVEDNLDNILLLERAFDGCTSVELSFAKDAASGLRLIRSALPDIVLLDLHLPDGSGSDVLASMRQDPATADIPVVILSADASPSQIDALLASGARAYLTKPVDLAALFNLINTLAPGIGRDNTI